jgi:hypothetical protein
MTIKTAKDCFAENFKLFGDARRDPERHNLYKGLHHVADVLASMQMKIDGLTREVAMLRQALATRRAKG